MDDSAIYVYCAVKAPRRPSIARAPAGIPQASAPEALDMPGSLWLIVSEVPLAVYGPAALEPNLRDLDWVARVAVAHEAVVEHFARARNAGVVPMKLFTMFSSRERAVQDVGRRRRVIQATLRRIAGCEEWGVRITRTLGAPSAADAVNGAHASGTQNGAGAAFLTARKTARDAALQARRAAALTAAGAFSTLSAVSKDARQRPSPEGTGSNPPMLEAAFLVRVGARARFRREARRQAAACAAAGAELTLSGPWPAYSFVGSKERRT